MTINVDKEKTTRNLRKSFSHSEPSCWRVTLPVPAGSPALAASITGDSATHATPFQSA